jgi:hypothetical protein
MKQSIRYTHPLSSLWLGILLLVVNLLCLSCKKEVEPVERLTGKSSKTWRVIENKRNGQVFIDPFSEKRWVFDKSGTFTWLSLFADGDETVEGTGQWELFETNTRLRLRRLNSGGGYGTWDVFEVVKLESSRLVVRQTRDDQVYEYTCVPK